MKQKAVAGVPTGVVGAEPTMQQDSNKFEGMQTLDHKPMRGKVEDNDTSLNNNNPDFQQSEGELFLSEKKSKPQRTTG